ncbi:MAG: Hsp20/alpha crystallin family protein [Pseudomonadota bacterium]
MTLVRYEPIRMIGRFNRDFSNFLAGDRAKEARGWVPTVDIREEDNRFVLFADIPGVARTDIDISLEDGVLTVKGERQRPSADAAGGWRHRERRHGGFLRRFTLPDSVDSASISATVKDGVLQIEIPKQAQLQARRISVS